MKRQTDLQLIGYIAKYGCFFMCMTYWITLKMTGTELDYDFLNRLWMDAIKKGIISGDVNKDGDMDDGNELLILDKDRLLTLAGINLRYIGSCKPEDVDSKTGLYFIGEFYNPRTKFTHFAGLDKNLKPEYDPIVNSMTVREGTLKTVRVYA
jgi:hypothetical protein